MQVPLRVLEATRLRVDPPLGAALAASTVVFAATPFLLRPVADEFGVSVGTAGLISTGQLAGFVVGSWAAGRFLRPVRRVFVVLGVLGVVANLASAAAPTFATLVITRFVAGVSLGLAAWFGWQDAFGDERKTGDTAVVGPLVGVVSSPAITLIVDAVGLRATFVVLAAIVAIPLGFSSSVAKVDRLRPHRTRHAPTRAARAILIALCLVTMGGSSVFVFAAAIGTEYNGLSPLAVSLLYSANALTGIPAAKWTGGPRSAGFWYAVTALAAFVMAAVHQPLVFSLALAGWGFVFFMATPAAFSLLASRSAFPEERAGDAQATMALGRVFGPLVGGALLAQGQTTTQGIVAAGLMICASILLLYADRDRFAVARRVPVVTRQV